MHFFVLFCFVFSRLDFLLIRSSGPDSAPGFVEELCISGLLCVCVCVCARARTRARVCENTAADHVQMENHVYGLVIP